MATDRESQLLLDATKAGISSQKELANFMAQVTQESGGLTRLEESFRYTKSIDQITVNVPSALHHKGGAESLETARVDALNSKPEKLGELMYGGRMGNNESGDGYKYRGRGYIQLTGKSEYQEAGKALGLDLVKTPDLAAQPEHASRIATTYWNQHVHDKAPEDVVKATHIINGKEAGLGNREEYFAQWKKALTPDVMYGLSKGEVRLPAGPVISTSHHSHAPSHQTTDGLLRKGMHGEQVQKLQTQLGELGYLDNVDTPDGKFGPTTEKAVKAFQHDHHLPEIGQAGPLTQRGIQSDLLPLKQDSHGLLPALSAMSSLPGGAPGLDDPRNAFNSNHALYEQLKARIPDASEQRLLQFTDACHTNKITAENLGQIHFDRQGGHMTFLTSWPPQAPATVDVKIPSPEAQHSIQHIQQYDQQRAQVAGQNQAQSAQVSQQGPAQGPMR